MSRKTWILDKQLCDAQSRISSENDDNHTKGHINESASVKEAAVPRDSENDSDLRFPQKERKFL